MSILGIVFSTSIALSLIRNDKDSFKGAIIAIGIGTLVGITIFYFKDTTSIILIDSNGIHLREEPGFRLW